MSEQTNPNTIRTRIWQEQAEPDNPFATRRAACHGYDVYGAMLGNARWVDMLYLLLRGEAPSARQAALLEVLAVALANPGPRDASVHAAMCGGVCGSTAAATLTAALAVGAGVNGGAREVLLAMQGWAACGTALDAWSKQFRAATEPQVHIWPSAEHVPGFEPHGVRCATIVMQTLQCLAGLSDGPHLAWLLAERDALEQAAGKPLAMSGVAACALHDLGFTPEQGEMLFLLLRLPGAAAHALEQRASGFRNFPFFSIELSDDPYLEQA